MSKRAQLRRQLKMLDELNGIMGAMKNLSLMEIVKLERLTVLQHRLLENVTRVAEDFLQHDPKYQPAQPPPTPRIAVVVGSQRGFCGEFNDVLVHALGQFERANAADSITTLAVGSRLVAKLAGHRGVTATLDGPSVLEDVQAVLLELIEALTTVLARLPANTLAEISVLAHRDGVAGVQRRALWPPPMSAARAHSHAPLLYLPPATFRWQLARHYLWAQLHDVFYGSLMAENRRRLLHMQGAMQRMEERRGALRRRFDMLRQEEITEEIEVILLSDRSTALPRRTR